MMVFRILPIQDFNEVTYHLLEALYVHLYNTRGPSTGGGSNTWNTMSTVQNNGSNYASNQYSNNYYAPQWGNNDNSLASAVSALPSNSSVDKFNCPLHTFTCSILGISCAWILRITAGTSGNHEQQKWEGSSYQCTVSAIGQTWSRNQKCSWFSDARRTHFQYFRRWYL